MQEAAPFLSLHSAFIPHGDSLHGSIISGRGVVAKNVFVEKRLNPKLKRYSYLWASYIEKRDLL